MTGTTRKITIQAGKTLIVVGPASFELREGNATTLAAPLDSRRHLVLRGKQTPIEIQSPSSLRLWIGEDGGIEELDGSTIPLSWREAASALTELGEGTTIVVAEADAGKSTLCTFLANLLIQKGIRVAIVDADIGQTDLGPPTTMAAGEVSEQIVNLSDVCPSERIFIGLTSPGRVKDKVIRSVKRLVGRHVKPGNLVIVNTDGWTTGSEAVTYKVQMLDEVQPDIVLGIGAKQDTADILQAGNRSTLLVSPPDTIRERSQIERKELRTLRYQKYLSGSSLKTFRANGASVRESLSSQVLDLRAMSWPRTETLKDAIVGFLGTDGFLQEIGVLKDIVPSTMTIRVWSRIAPPFKEIEVGCVRLSNDGHELGYVEG